MAETPQPTTSPATYGTALWSNLVSLAIVCWFCVRNLAVAIEARGHVAALLAVPPWWLYAAGLLLAAAGLVAALVARLRGLPPDRPWYRLLPVLAVIFLAVQIFALPQYRLPLPTDDIVAAQASTLDSAAFVDEAGLFTLDGARVSAGLQALDAPFLGRDGASVGKWRAVVRTDCTGPVTEAPAALDAGAVLYCVSADRAQAWLSFVTVTGVAGPPRVLAAEESGGTLSWDLRPPSKAGVQPPPAPAPEKAAGANE